MNDFLKVTAKQCVTKSEFVAMPTHEVRLPASVFEGSRSGLRKQANGVLCTCCGGSFSNMFNARRHFTKQHTQPVPGDCTHCGLHFNSQDALGTHLKERHGFTSGELRGQETVHKQQPSEQPTKRQRIQKSEKEVKKEQVKKED